MKQGTEMKINRLPVRTWNWLHMNESSLSDIDTVLLSRDKPADGPVLTLPKEGVSCIRGMSTGMVEAGFRDIATGMGPDMEELIRESGTPVEIIRVNWLFPARKGNMACMRPMCMRKKAAASR